MNPLFEFHYNFFRLPFSHKWSQCESKWNGIFYKRITKWQVWLTFKFVLSNFSYFSFLPLYFIVVSSDRLSYSYLHFLHKPMSGALWSSTTPSIHLTGPAIKKINWSNDWPAHWDSRCVCTMLYCGIKLTDFWIQKLLFVSVHHYEISQYMPTTFYNYLKWINFSSCIHSLSVSSYSLSFCLSWVSSILPDF
jgi:hypothetical protein